MTVALVALVASLVLMATAVPAFGQGTSTVTQADCNAGRIKDRQGNTITGARCSALVGKRVSLASTGADAWLIALAGGVCLAGGFALRRRPRARLQT